MSEPLEQLEREVEAELGLWSDLLAVEPTSVAIGRVKVALRHELNEQWLGEQPVVEPTLEATSRVRAAIGSELERLREAASVEGDGVVSSRRRAWIVAVPALAAAAMIAISIGLVRYGEVGPTTVVPTQTRVDTHVEQVVRLAEEHVEAFIALADDVLAEDTFVASVQLDLGEIEEGVNTVWLSLDSNEESLEELSNEIDGLFVDVELWET